MTGIVIADDELLIRQGLQSISWSNYGIEVKGIASNGTEALSLIECTFPEILLTDIRMPGMDGLKLIDAAKKILPEIKAILLTGYQDFNYAHSAIQLGAMGYILKPSDPNEIIRTVMKVKEQIDAELKDKLERDRVRRQMESVQDILVNSFLIDLLYGRVTDDEVIVENSEKFGLSFNNSIVMIIEASFENAEPDSKVMSSLKHEICNISSDLNKVKVLDLNSNAVCVLIEFPSSKKPDKEILLSMATGIQSHLESQFSIHIGIGIGVRCSSASQLHKGCNQALNCLKMRSSLGNKSIVHIDDLVNCLNGKNGQPPVEPCGTGDGSDGYGMIAGIAPVRNVVVRNILDYIDSHFMNDISLITVSEHVYMNHIYLSRLIKKETGENFIDILTRTRLRKACEMLRDCSLKAYEIADMVGIKDSGYFSQVFKKHFGMTPSEFRENALSSMRSKA